MSRKWNYTIRRTYLPRWSSINNLSTKCVKPTANTIRAKQSYDTHDRRNVKPLYKTNLLPCIYRKFQDINSRTVKKPPRDQVLKNRTPNHERSSPLMLKSDPTIRETGVRCWLLEGLRFHFSLFTTASSATYNHPPPKPLPLMEKAFVSLLTHDPAIRATRVRDRHLTRMLFHFYCNITMCCFFSTGVFFPHIDVQGKVGTHL